VGVKTPAEKEAAAKAVPAPRAAAAPPRAAAEAWRPAGTRALRRTLLLPTMGLSPAAMRAAVSRRSPALRDPPI